MRLTLLSLLLSSCYLHAPLEDQATLQPVPTTAPSSAPAASLQPPPASAPTTQDTEGRYTARVQSTQEECSGLGGLHVVFEILDRGGDVIALAHTGGHGYRPPQLICVGDVYTVKYTPTESATSYSNPGWCVFTPALDGRAEPLNREETAPRKTNKLSKEQGGGTWETCEYSYSYPGTY